MKPEPINVNVQLRYYEIFDHVTEGFSTVEDALLYYKKHKSHNKRKVNWFGGEYRFKDAFGNWSEWQRID
jgi:translation elongation factor EF-G